VVPSLAALSRIQGLKVATTAVQFAVELNPNRIHAVSNFDRDSRRCYGISPKSFRCQAFAYRQAIGRHACAGLPVSINQESRLLSEECGKEETRLAA
jgi:hypothetical protein